MSIKKKLQRAYEAGDWGLFISDTPSARTILSLWSRETGIKYKTFRIYGDMLVLFGVRTADKLLSE